MINFFSSITFFWAGRTGDPKSIQVNGSKIIIPTSVTSLDEKFLSDCNNTLQEVIIPSTIKIIPKDSFKSLELLTNITIPINKNEILLGEKLFSIENLHFSQSIILPQSIKIINGKEVENLTSLEIPTTVTSLDKDCFHSCNLCELIIPDTVKSIPKYCIKNCWNLTNITLPMNESQMIIGNRIFKKNQHFEQDILLPQSIKIINNQSVECSEFIVPSFVTSLDEYCFEYLQFGINKIIIPESVKFIPHKTLYHLPSSDDLILPSHFSECGNKILFVMEDGAHFIHLSSSMKKINGRKANYDEKQTLIIPSHVTKLSENCFPGFIDLIELVLPETLVEIPHNTLFIIPSLQNLVISKQFTLYGDRMFRIKDKCLYSIQLPETIRKINGEFQNLKPLESFSILSNVTKLSNYCFANCEELTEINGLEYIKEFGKDCFYGCFKLNKEKYPQVKKNEVDSFNKLISEQERKQLEEWCNLKCSDILFNYYCDNISEEKTQFIERIKEKRNLVFLIENTDGEVFGYFTDNEIDNNNNQSTNPFHFNLKSNNNRLPGPMKFEVKDKNNCGCKLFQKWEFELFQFGDINIVKENWKNHSFCFQNEDYFDYHGIQNALCGKTVNETLDNKIGNCFTPKRIVVIQMK